VASIPSGGGEERLSDRDIQQYYVRNNDGNMVPLFRRWVTTRRISGPEYTKPLQRLSRGPGDRRRRAGIQFRTGHGALEEVAKQELPRRRLVYDWADLSYQEKRLREPRLQCLGCL